MEESNSVLMIVSCRISDLGKVCAKAWSSKLHAAFQHSILRDLKESLENAEKETENLYQS